jgi:hypothetical protein
MSNAMALCTYRVKENDVEKFIGLLREHAPTLRRLGLVTEEPSLLFRGRDESGKSFFVEVLHWKSKDDPAVAEQAPEVLAIWERMGQCVEDRLGRPSMEFPHVEPLDSA